MLFQVLCIIYQSVVVRLMPPKDVHALIPKTYELF